MPLCPSQLAKLIFFCVFLQVFDRDRVMNIFQEVVAQLEQALHDFPYNELDISDEVREQVILSA